MEGPPVAARACAFRSRTAAASTVGELFKAVIRLVAPQRRRGPAATASQSAPLAGRALQQPKRTWSAAPQARLEARHQTGVVYLNPPDAAPALASGKVEAWSMWGPGVDIARIDFRAHDVFLEGRDLDFQIDYTSWLVTSRFAAEKYGDAVRDGFIAMKRRYLIYPVTDQAFVTDLQKAADWLVARKVLPEAVTVSDHLARL